MKEHYGFCLPPSGLHLQQCPRRTVCGPGRGGSGVAAQGPTLLSWPTHAPDARSLGLSPHHPRQMTYTIPAAPGLFPPRTWSPSPHLGPPPPTFFFSGNSLYFLDRILVRSRLLISGWSFAYLARFSMKKRK